MATTAKNGWCSAALCEKHTPPGVVHEAQKASWGSCIMRRTGLECCAWGARAPLNLRCLHPFAQTRSSNSSLEAKSSGFIGRKQTFGMLAVRAVALRSHIKHSQMKGPFCQSSSAVSPPSVKPRSAAEEHSRQSGMLFVCSVAALKEGISRVMTAIARRRAVVPILSHILIEAIMDAQGCTYVLMTATDGAVAVKCSVPGADIRQPGVSAVPAKSFFTLIRELSATAQVEISAAQFGGIVLNAGNAKFMLQGEKASDFPVVAELSGAAKMVFPAGTLKNMLMRTRFAAAREDDSRYILNSVHMRVSDGHVLFVATDSRRLAGISTNAEVEGLSSGEFTLPIRAVDEICRGLGRDSRMAKGEEKEEVAVMELLRDKVCVRFSDGGVVVSQLLVGNYPDLMRLMEHEPEVVAKVDRGALMALLRQMALFCEAGPGSGMGAGAVHFHLRSGTLWLSAGNSDVGEGKASMDVDYSGKPVDIAFNPALYIDALLHCDGETVSMGFSKAGGGLSTVKDELSTFLIMAMMVQPPQQKGTKS